MVLALDCPLQPLVALSYPTRPPNDLSAFPFQPVRNLYLNYSTLSLVMGTFASDRWRVLRYPFRLICLKYVLLLSFTHFLVKYRQQSANVDIIVTRKQFFDFLFQVIRFRFVFLWQNVCLCSYACSPIGYHIE